MAARVLFFAFLALAMPANAALNSYTCQILMITKSQPVLEKHVTVDAAESPSHGGKTFQFKHGPYDLQVSADSRWLTIGWQRDGKLLAAGMFVLGNESESPRVAILYNPLDPEEQTSLGCEPK